MHAHQSTQVDAGVAVDPDVAWSFLELMLVVGAHLKALDKQMARLCAARLGMTATLWPEAVAPNSVTRLARWLEAGVARLHAWRVSVARAGANLALWFAMSLYPALDLNQLAAQRAGTEADLEARALRIARAG